MSPGENCPGQLNGNAMDNLGGQLINFAFNFMEKKEKKEFRIFKIRK